MKKLIGVDVGNYTFSASTKTIVISGVPLKAESFLIIQHVPSKATLFHFLDAALGGTFSAPGTLVLSYDTTSFSDSDPLQIWADVDLPQEVSLIKDDSPDNLNVDVSDIYVRALLRKLMQLKYTNA